MNKHEISLDGPVLAIDDDEGFRKELRQILESNGIPCITQESSNHALRFLQNQPWNWKPGVVITDIVMDGMGGYQLIRRIQELYPNRDIPFLVISKLSGGLDVGEAEVAGASGYLTKPTNENAILEMLAKITNKDKKGMVVFSHHTGARLAR